ncbi:hypothetical protein UlMin_023218 [Ulmus minor]
MAKTNKYTSINFNHIYEKNLPNNSNPNTNPNPTKTLASSSSTSFSYSAVSSPNTKSHGRMLVLTRPTPKPISIPQPVSSPQSQPQQASNPGRPEPTSDEISLRPLGRTGTGSPILSPVTSHERGNENQVQSKPGKFVPPHLRPGFVSREEKTNPDVIRARETGQRHFGSPGRFGEEGRPKSGGGYERMRKGGESDLGMMNRPGSSGNRPGFVGNRPSSSGW